MKVFHLITTIDLGGAEQQLCILAEEQVRNDVEVEVIPLKGNAELLSKLEGLGARVNLDFLNMNPALQLLFLRGYFKNNVGIIHSHLPRAEIISAFSKGTNRLVISKHNAEIFIPKGNPLLSRLLSKLVLRQATSIIAISNAVNEFLIQSRELNKHAHVMVIHYGFRQAQKLVLPPAKDVFLIGTVSRLVEQKDIPTLLRAFALVSKRIPNARLQILGIGPLRGQLLNLASELGITGKVDWLGKSDKVLEVMSSWSVFTLTSRYEGFGLVLLEAMSARVPIVATNTSAIPEVIGNDPSQLFEPGDHNGLAERIIHLTNSSARGTIVQAQTVRLGYFSAVKMELKIREIYGQSRS